MSLAERAGLRLFTFSAMFFAQGIGWGVTAVIIPAYLGARGVKMTGTATVLAISVLPFAFKWVWGPLMDAFTIERLGRRRPWLIFTQGMMAVSLAALLLVDDLVASFDLLLVLMLVHTIFNAMQNVATDALALDLLSESERGRANGLMYGFKYGGGVVASTGISLLDLDIKTSIAILSAILAAITLVPLLVREHAGAPPPRRPLGEIVGALGRVLRVPAVLVAGLAMLCINLGGGVLASVSPVLFTQDLHWDDHEYSKLAGIGLAAGFSGSLLAGFVADKLGHRRLAALGVVLLGFVWLGWALAYHWWASRWVSYPLFVLEPFSQSTMIVALFTVCMDTTTKPTATTQFAFYTSLMNCSQLIASYVLVPVVKTWSYRSIYFGAAAAQVVLLAVVALIDVHQAKRALTPEVDTRPGSARATSHT